MFIRKVVSMLIRYCCGSMKKSKSVRGDTMAELGHICAVMSLSGGSPAQL